MRARRESFGVGRMITIALRQVAEQIARERNSLPAGLSNMIRNRQDSGFTLIELMIVVAIIAIIASMALPKFVASRMSANEAAAISTLRMISTAEAQFQAQGAIDSDADGAGEHAYFGELAGTATLRESLGGAPAPGTTALNPAVLSSAFGALNAQSLVSRSGYYFQLWLPGASAGGGVPGIAEMPLVGGADPSNFPEPNNCEVLWCCYAWPMNANESGNRVFFINQQ